jgi:predicted nucleotidyltransferase
VTGLGALLRGAVAALAQRSVRHALVGGLAVSVRTEPRFTRDVDLAVAVASDAEAEALVASLVPPYRLLATVEHEALDRLAAVRLGTGPASDEGAVLDLLFASSGVEAEVVAGAEPLEVLPGITVPVASTGHLIALKLLARAPSRPQDEVDLRALVDVADRAELDRARSAVDLIEARGAQRGRALRSELEQLLAST